MRPQRGATRRTNLNSGNVTDLPHLEKQGKAALSRGNLN